MKRTRSPNGLRKPDQFYKVRNLPEGIQAQIAIQARHESLSVAEFITKLVKQYLDTLPSKPVTEQDRALLRLFGHSAKLDGNNGS